VRRSVVDLKALDNNNVYGNNSIARKNLAPVFSGRGSAAPKRNN
jgi:hypothetical protein